MSSLPEQKKTPEEIAALRDKLGIPSAAQADADTSSPDEVVAELKPEPAASPVRPVHVVPAAPVKIDSASGLPLRRHSDEELEDLRRRGMFETQDEALRMPVRRAHGAWVITGYLFAASAAIPVYLELSVVLPVAVSAAALGFAAFLFFLRPYSRHHGAFISVVVLFVLIYAAFNYVPQLQHAL